MFGQLMIAGCAIAVILLTVLLMKLDARAIARKHEEDTKDD